LSSHAVQRGRSQGDELDARILYSAVHILGEVGYGGLTIDDLSRHSRVAKTTIYRRWANKMELVMDAMDILWTTSETACSASLAADLEREIVDTLRAFKGPLGRAKVSVYAESLHNPELAKVWNSKVRRPREEALRSVLTRATGHGGPGTGAHIDETVAMLVGLALYYALFSKEPIPTGLAARAANTALCSIDPNRNF
jgi:AcrR family transcriptional regulator